MSVAVIPQDKILSYTSDHFMDQIKALRKSIALLRENSGNWGLLATASTFVELDELRGLLSPEGMKYFIEQSYNDSDHVYKLWGIAVKAAAANTKAKDYEEKVVNLCSHLAERVEANGYKVTNPHTQAWLKAAKGVFERAAELGKSDESVLALVEWATSDGFWKDNIRSMPKFEKQYDRLRNQANESLKKSGPKVNKKIEQAHNALDNIFGAKS